MRRIARLALVGLGIAALAASVAGMARGGRHAGAQWGPPVDLGAPVDTANFEGCPAESPDGKSLYFASSQSIPGNNGPLNIWVSHRASKNAPWGDPAPLPAPVNTDAFEFCPTPVPGNGLYFVSSRPGYCGQAQGATFNSDIYFTKYDPATGGWSTPVHLACAADGGPNTTGWQQGPSYFRAGGHGYLYFSSSPYSAGGPDFNNGHIYASEQRPDGSFGPGTIVIGLNSDYADIRPNVSASGKEVVFGSTRDDPAHATRKIYIATRQTPHSPWSTPVVAVNTTDQVHRATLSRDGKRLYFGSLQPGGRGSADIWVSTRTH